MKVYLAGTTDIRALDGVDLDLFTGELVVLVGPSDSSIICFGTQPDKLH
jgi:ABC-type lipoprotein export system ATPase subunit